MAIVSAAPASVQSELRLPPASQLDAPISLRLWHLLSLDAPTVAVVWDLAFAWACHLRLPVWIPSVLALAAWCLYVADRLLDAHNATSPLRARHYFHWKHRFVLLPLAAIAAIAAIAMVAHSMPAAARERNSVLGLAALAYFSSVHSPWRGSWPNSWQGSWKRPAPRFRFPKELQVGILFTLACAAPALARIPAPSIIRIGEQIPALLIFIALAWLNCHAIEVWESDSRKRRTVFIPAIALALAAVFAALATCLYNPRQALLLGSAALSAILLAAIDCRKHRFTPIALRVCADLALLTPLMLLVVRS